MKQINKAKLYKHLHHLPERFVYFYVVPWLTLKLSEVRQTGIENTQRYRVEVVIVI